MLAKALLCIAAAIHFTQMAPKGKYFLIETQDKGETGDDGGVKEENDLQGTDDDGGVKEENDLSLTAEDAPKPMMTKQGIKSKGVPNKAIV